MLDGAEFHVSFTEPSQRTATKAPNIRAWRMEKLINDLALGDKPIRFWPKSTVWRTKRSGYSP